MAQGSDTKMYVALGVLALLGGAYFMQRNKAEKAAAEHSIDAEDTKLPSLSLSEEDTKTITKIVIDKPAKKDEESDKPAEKVVLEKDGDTWRLVEPVKALANQKNVESLLENLTKVEAKEQVSSSKDNYAQYEVNDEKALSTTFYAGDKVVRAIWAGKSGGRGQMARVDGHDGVYILGGYSSFLYSRDVKGWRDLSILELDTEEATAVTVQNENGEFTFQKEGDEWTGQFKEKDGGSPKPISEFEPKKVTDLLNAYKKLNASGFGDDKTLAEAGLENPAATLTIQLGEDRQKVVQFGESAEGSSKWAKLPDAEQVYSVSSWAADWAFAEVEKFQKKAEDEEGADDAPSPMPGGLPPGMQMPGGHP